MSQTDRDEIVRRQASLLVDNGQIPCLAMRKRVLSHVRELLGSIFDQTDVGDPFKLGRVVNSQYIKDLTAEAYAAFTTYEDHDPEISCSPSENTKDDTDADTDHNDSADAEHGHGQTANPGTMPYIYPVCISAFRLAIRRLSPRERYMAFAIVLEWVYNRDRRPPIPWTLLPDYDVHGLVMYRNLNLLQEHATDDLMNAMECLYFLSEPRFRSSIWDAEHGLQLRCASRDSGKAGDCDCPSGLHISESLRDYVVARLHCAELHQSAGEGRSRILEEVRKTICRELRDDDE
jgi:hypothetical protein